MNKIEIAAFKLIGLGLKIKTTNEDSQSNTDCGNLWQRFEKEQYADRIEDKLSNELFAVYHSYDGDHTKPFSYFIGCKVKIDAKVPEGMDSLIIADGKYQLFRSSGKIPDCIINTWKEIWNSNLQRTYKTDFEVYGEKSKDWSNAEIEIFLSVN